MNLCLVLHRGRPRKAETWPSTSLFLSFWFHETAFRQDGDIAQRVTTGIWFSRCLPDVQFFCSLALPDRLLIYSQWISHTEQLSYCKWSFFSMADTKCPFFFSSSQTVSFSQISTFFKANCRYLSYPGFRSRIDLMRIRIRIRIQHFF
jgi:hypothetical protein